MTPDAVPDGIDALGATPAAWRALARALLPRALVLMDGAVAWQVSPTDDGPAYEPVPAGALSVPRVECDLTRLALALARTPTPIARAFALAALFGSERGALGVRLVPDTGAKNGVSSLFRSIDAFSTDTRHARKASDPFFRGQAPAPIVTAIDLAPELSGEVGAAAWPDGLRASLAIAVGNQTWRVDLGSTLAIDCAPRPAGPIDALARAARASGGAELALAVEPATGAWAVSLPLEPADAAGLVGADAAAALARIVADALGHARSVAARRTLAFDLVRDGAPWHRLWLAEGRVSSTAPADPGDPLVLGCDLTWIRRLLALPQGASRRVAAWVEALLPRRLRYAVAGEEIVALVRSGPDAWLAVGGGEHQLGALWEGEQWRATLGADGRVIDAAADPRRAPVASRRQERIAIRFDGDAGPIALGGTLGPARPIAWGPAAGAAEHGLAASVLPGSRGTARLAALDAADESGGGVADGRALVVATSGLRWRALLEVRETRLYAVVAGTGDDAWSAIACVCAPAGLEAFAAFRKAAPTVMACRWGDAAVLPALRADVDHAPRLVLPAGVRAVPLSAIATPLEGRGRYSARLRIGLAGAGIIGVVVVVHPFEARSSPGGSEWDERPWPLELASCAGGLRVSRGAAVLFELGIEVDRSR